MLWNWIIQTTLYLSVTIGFILAFKAIFNKRLSANWNLFIWSLVPLRLLTPLLPASKLSVFRIFSSGSSSTGFGSSASNSASQSAAFSDPTAFENIISNINNAMNTPAPLSANTLAAAGDSSAIIGSSLALVWLVCAGALVIYFSITYAIFSIKIKDYSIIREGESFEILQECKNSLNIRFRGNVRIFCGGDTPALKGFFRPVLLMPEGYTADEQRDIITHELCHHKNCDVLILWTGILVLCLNWFNPLVWYAFFVLRRDIELRCDQQVLRHRPDPKAYASLLLKTALLKNRFVLAAACLQHGEKEVSRRIKYMAFFRKPGVIVSAVILVAALGIGAVCLTNCVLDTSDDGSANSAMDNENLYADDADISENENADIGSDNSSASVDSELYTKTAAYLEGEFKRVFSPYYDIVDLKISDWQEDGNTATFFYTMYEKNYNRDPDTVQYIIDAKNNAKTPEQYAEYEQLKKEYLKVSEGNFQFKIVMKNDNLELYSNESPNGTHWVPIKIDDYISA